MSAPQPPYHRWRANEETRIKPFGLLDHCLDCGALRYDQLIEWSGISEGRRALAERRNAAASAPCPGPQAEERA